MDAKDNLARDETEASKVDRYAVHPGEPGRGVITEFRNGEPVIENLPVPLPLSAPASLPSTVPQQESRAVIPSLCNEIACYRASLMELFEKRTAERGETPKSEIIDCFLKEYNAGLLLPKIRKELGAISRSTLYVWSRAFSEKRVDGLTPRRGRKGLSKVNDHERDFLLRLLLNENQLNISNAIALTKMHLKTTGIETPSGHRSLRRFANQYRREHFDVWTRKRGGDKALDDKCLPYAERDWRLLEVGQILVGDGHRLNFQIRHPETGRPCRAAMVLFWDWRSAYPCGWEIMVEENTQCIATALRNSILTLGKIPKTLLIDNGKAFKSKIFLKDVDLEDSSLPGMFRNLDIKVRFARPYNAKDKPIEPWFGIFSEQFERLMPSYVGSSIEDKPGSMRRNESYLKSIHNEYVPTIQETNQFITAWRDNFYALQPRRGRDGRTASDLLAEGKGPGVNPAELTYLMMATTEPRTIHRNGVTWLGWHWYDEGLYGRNERVYLRYSLVDLSQIYVFSIDHKFICVAKPVEKINPDAWNSESPKDMEAVKRVGRIRNKLKAGTKKLCDLLDTVHGQYIDWDIKFRGSPEIAETIKAIEDKKRSKIVPISPFPDDVIYNGALDSETRDKKSGNEEPDFQFQFERYEYLLRKDPYTYTEEQKNFVEFFVTTSEYTAIYGTPDGQRILESIRFGKEESRQKDKEKEPVFLNEADQGNQEIAVNQETGLSYRPSGNPFVYPSERYDWYQEIEKKYPGVLGDADWDWIQEYEATEEWKKFYLQRLDSKRMRAGGKWASNDPLRKEVEGMSIIKADFKRYLTLMGQVSFTEEERDFIRDFRCAAPLYKCIYFNDDAEIDAKVNHEKSICDDEERQEVPVSG